MIHQIYETIDTLLVSDNDFSNNDFSYYQADLGLQKNLFYQNFKPDIEQNCLFNHLTLVLIIRVIIVHTSI